VFRYFFIVVGGYCNSGTDNHLGANANTALKHIFMVLSMEPIGLPKYGILQVPYAGWLPRSMETIVYGDLDNILA